MFVKRKKAGVSGRHMTHASLGEPVLWLHICDIYEKRALKSNVVK